METPKKEIEKLKEKFFELGDFYTNSANIIYENFLRRYYDRICEFNVETQQSKLELKLSEKRSLADEIVRDGTGALKKDFETICIRYIRTRKTLLQDVEGNSDIKKDFSAGETLAQNVARTQLITEPFIKFYEDKHIYGRCKPNFINKISLNNRYEWVDRDKLFDKLLPYLHVLIVIVMLVMIVGFEYWHENYCAKLEAQSLKVGDYSLRFYNLPHGEKYQGYPLRANLINSVRYGEYRNVVTDINFVYDIDRYMEAKEELAKQIVKDYRDELKRHLDEVSEGDFKVIGANDRNMENESLQTEIASDKTKQLIDEIDKWEKRYDEDDITLMTGHAYISFKTIEIRDLFYQKFKKKGFFYNNFRIFHKRDVELSIPVNNEERMIYCKRPTEPHDILWENLKYSRLSRFFRRLSADIISFLILVIGFFVLYYMKTDRVSTILIFS